MPAYVAGVIIWTCVVAFVLCVVGAMLIVFNRWEPKDPHIRTWLLRGVLFFVVGAVATFATKQFSTPAEVTANTAQAAAARNAPSPGDGPRPAPARGPQPPLGRDTPPSPGPSPAPPFDSEPPEVRAWAAQNLGPRPDVPPEFLRAYPACVATLRRLDFDAIGLGDAEMCREQLDSHRQRYFVPLYTLRENYGAALRNQATLLQRRGLTQDELRLFNFIQSENEDIFQEGRTLTAFEDAETQIQDDIRLCRTNRCKPRS